MEIYSNPVNKDNEVLIDFIGVNLEASKTTTDIVVRKKAEFFFVLRFFQHLGPFQTDFSGKLRTGTPIMGILSLNNNNMVHDPNYVWQVPSSWSQEEAATVPLPFLFVSNPLLVVGKK